MKRTRFLLLLLLLGVHASAAFATGINVYFNADSVRDRNNAVLAAGDYHEYKPRLEFFHQTNPANPTNSTGKYALNPGEYSLVGGQHKYQLAGLNGGTLYVRVWKDTPSGDRKGNYYGVASHPVAAGATPPYDWTIASIKTDHKADVPYKPGIGNISESLVRQGDDLKLKLVVPITYNNNPSGGDGIREAQSFSLAVTNPDGSTVTKTGQSISLDDTPAGTYKFKPTAANWYGSTVGDEVVYVTLGVGAAGPDTAIYDFIKQVDGLGVNTFPIAYTTFQNPAVANIKELVESINAQAGEPIVTAIGWWDPAKMEPAGYTVTIDPATKTVKGYTPSAGLAADPALAPFTRDMVVQVSVLKSSNFQVTGLR